MKHSFNQTFLNQTFLISFFKKINSFERNDDMSFKGHPVYGYKYTVND